MADHWLLDANVISLLFEEDCEGALAKAGAGGVELATTASVVEELRRARATNRPWAARCAAWVLPAGMACLDMELGGAAWTAYEALRRQRRERRGSATGVDAAMSLKDQGELTCIAHAVTDSEMIFVAHDRNALWWAAHEVVPWVRIASVAGFVRMLHEGGHLTTEEGGKLGRNRNLRDHLPTWWAARFG